MDKRVITKEEKDDATEAIPAHRKPVSFTRSRLEARLAFTLQLKTHSPSLFEMKNGWRNWPMVANKYLDLYVLFQLVLQNGGYENVVACKLWQTCGRALHVPKTCTSLSYQLRQNYEKHLLGIETEYKSKRLHQLEALKLETQSTPSERVVESRNINTEAKESGATENTSPERSAKFFDFGNLVDVDMHQEAGALAMGFPAQAMTPLEIAAFPDFAYQAIPERRSVYLDIRNHVLLKWTQAIGTELLLQKHLVDPLVSAYPLDDKDFMEVVDINVLIRVFNFLESNGSVNVGSFSRTLEPSERKWTTGSKCGKQKHIVVVGAGFAGLAAATQLRYFGHKVTVLEARNRVGGRVLTDRSFKNGAVDLGAMLITGAIGHPCTMLCDQLDQPRHVVKSNCPLYINAAGDVVDKEVDEKIEQVFNKILALASQEKDTIDIPRKRKRVTPASDETKLQHKHNTPTSDMLHEQVFKRLTKSLDASTTNTPLPKPSLDDVALTDTAVASLPPGISPPDTTNAQSELKKVVGACQASAAAARIVSERVRQEYNVATNEDTLKKDYSLQEVLEYMLKREFPEGLTSVENSVLQWHLANLEYGCASNLLNVSNHQWDQDDEYNWEGDHLLFPNGFGAITDALSRRDGLHDEIVFGAKVETIEYNSDEAQSKLQSNLGDMNKDVRVSYVDESGKGVRHSIDADAVVVTIPLGVMQQGAISFKPGLPDWKVGALNRMGFGNLNKVVLEFPYVFWDETKDIFGRVVTSENCEQTFLNGNSKQQSSGAEASPNLRSEERGEFYLFWAQNRCQGRPIVIVLMAGDAALNVENCKESQVVSKLLKVMERFVTPGRTMPEPIHAAVTRWGQDEFAKGSYSYIQVGGTGDDYDLLAEPVSNRVFFAGEATSREHPATTGGAFSSGLREAGKIACLFGRMSQVAAGYETTTLHEWYVRRSVMRIFNPRKIEEPVAENEYNNNGDDFAHRAPKNKVEAPSVPQPKPRLSAVEVAQSSSMQPSLLVSVKQ